MNFWDMVSGAPWWVYALFIYLLIVGIKATKSRTLTVQRLAFLPLLFVAWSLYGLYTKALLGFPSLIVYWIVFLALGTFLGIKEVHKWKLYFDQQKMTVTIPGNYSTIVLIFLIFILKFTWGYFYATLSPVPHWIYFADIITSAFVTGFFVGRAGFFIRSYLKR